MAIHFIFVQIVPTSLLYSTDSWRGLEDYDVFKMFYWIATMSMELLFVLFIIISFNFHNNLCGSHNFTIVP